MTVKELLDQGYALIFDSEEGFSDTFEGEQNLTRSGYLVLKHPDGLKVYSVPATMHIVFGELRERNRPADRV